MPNEKINNIVILQPSYIPWLGYFDLFIKADIFVFYDDVQFDRRGWRHRNRILSPKGEPHWLTIPIDKKGNYLQTINETQVADINFFHKHLNTIFHFYKKAPHFDLIYNLLENVFIIKTKSLLQICLKIHDTFIPFFNSNTKTYLSSELGYKNIGKTERLISICKKLKAKRYISPNSAKIYINSDLFSQKEVELVYQNFNHPTYNQYNNKFISHLSVIDALMFCGNDVSKLLNK